MTCPIVERALEGLDPVALKTSPEYRRAATRMNPMLFALIYFPEHLKGTDGTISFSEAHVSWYEIILSWAKTKTRAQENRNAIISSRSMGKSTTFFLIGVAWAIAHLHTDYVFAFSSSDSQAQEHLRTLRDECETNELLRLDYPEMCKRKNRVRGGPDGDNTNTRRFGNGAVMQARGITSAVLGAKIGHKRPSLILLDDIENSEGTYSEHMVMQRLETLRSDILPLSRMADVLLVGTTTRYNSILHQMARHNRGDKVDWVGEDEWKIHHSKPIVLNEDGTERSIWELNPLFTIEALKKISAKSYAKNYDCDPDASDSEFWNPDTFTYGDVPTSLTYLSIDPALSAKATSDQTGISVVGYSPETDQCVVRFSAGNRLQGEALRQYVLGVLVAFPQVQVILIESNAGGEAWNSVFYDMPVKVVLFRNHLPKEARFAELLTRYESYPPKVMHAEPLHDLQRQMLMVPFGKTDDLVDSVAHAVLRFMKPKKRIKATIRQTFQR